MVPMAGTLTSAVGAATGIQNSSRSSQAASRSLLPPASSHTEVPTLPRSDIPGRNLDSDDGGDVDVEGTVPPPSRLESDASVITDTGFNHRQESDVSLITDVSSDYSNVMPRRATVPLLQKSEL